MAKIQPYAEPVGAEVIAPRFTAADVIDLPPTRPDGSPWNVGDGRPVEEILAYAVRDLYRMHLPPSAKEQLAELDELDDEMRLDLERGYVEIPVAHLRDLAPGTKVRVGCTLTYTDPEIARPGL